MCNTSRANCSHKNKSYWLSVFNLKKCDFFGNIAFVRTGGERRATSLSLVLAGSSRGVWTSLISRRCHSVKQHFAFVCQWAPGSWRSDIEKRDSGKYWNLQTHPLTLHSLQLSSLNVTVPQQTTSLFLYRIFGTMGFPGELDLLYLQEAKHSQLYLNFLTTLREQAVTIGNVGKAASCLCPN